MKLYFRFTAYNWLFEPEKLRLQEIMDKLGYRITIIDEALIQHLHIDIGVELKPDEILSLGILIGNITAP